MIVNISAADMAAMFLFKNIHLSASEAAKEETELRVAKVNEKHVSGCVRIELVLSEDAIVKSDGS